MKPEATARTAPGGTAPAKREGEDLDPGRPDRGKARPAHEPSHWPIRKTRGQCQFELGEPEVAQPHTVLGRTASSQAFWAAEPVSIVKGRPHWWVWARGGWGTPREALAHEIGGGKRGGGASRPPTLPLSLPRCGPPERLCGPAWGRGARARAGRAPGAAAAAATAAAAAAAAAATSASVSPWLGVLFTGGRRQKCS